MEIEKLQLEFTVHVILGHIILKLTGNLYLTCLIIKYEYYSNF